MEPRISVWIEEEAGGQVEEIVVEIEGEGEIKKDRERHTHIQTHVRHKQ